MRKRRKTIGVEEVRGEKKEKHFAKWKFAFENHRIGNDFFFAHPPLHLGFHCSSPKSSTIDAESLGQKKKGEKERKSLNGLNSDAYVCIAFLLFLLW